MRRVVLFMVLKLPRGASEEVGKDLVRQVKDRIGQEISDRSPIQRRMFQERRKQGYAHPFTLV
uniref:Putative ovule protein n=1 Tax=Solanum chacoense TaxID=4108 RepID=A0A0V0GKD6_SOLCH